MIRQIALPTCTLAGVTGSAAGTATTTHPIAAEVLAVYVNYTGGTATEDVVVQTQNTGQTILTLSNNQTDGWYYVTDAPIPVVDYVQTVVAQGGTAGNTVDVSLVVRF